MPIENMTPRFSGTIRVNRDSYPVSDSSSVSPALKKIWTKHVNKLEKAVSAYQSQFDKLPGVDVTISLKPVHNSDIAQITIEKDQVKPSDSANFALERQVGWGLPPEDFLGAYWNIFLSRLGLKTNEQAYPRQFIKRVLQEVQKRLK